MTNLGSMFAGCMNMKEKSKGSKSKVMFFWSFLTGVTILFLWSSAEKSGNRVITSGKSPICPAASSYSTRALQSPDEANANGTCSPKHRIVFIKTHKTASSTTASILERYGYHHNLSFAVRPAGHVLTETVLFHRSVVGDANPISANCSDNSFDMLTNHARYNRPEMEAVVHHAKYITIIREPVAQFESSFGYFEVPEKLGLTKFENPLEEFMRDPTTYLNMKSYNYYWQMMRNGQLFDLGLDHDSHDDEYSVDYKIATLAKELDLVMLTEYFHESLVLLRKLLCWDMEQMLYISNGVRDTKRRYEITPELRSKIRKWNHADEKLYGHFNRTFWKQVEDYGPSFREDLATFRRMQKELTQECINFNATVDDGRELKYKLKADASARCKDILRGDVSYTSLIQDRMRENGQVAPKLSLAYLRDLFHSVYYS